MKSAAAAPVSGISAPMSSSTRMMGVSHHIGRHETTICLLRLAHDRLAPHVEAGVDENGAAGPTLERLTQRMLATVPDGVDGLDPGRVVPVRDGGYGRPGDLQLREALEFLARRLRDPLVLPYRRDEQHTRACSMAGCVCGSVASR